MKLLALALAIVAASDARAQQELYACTEDGRFVRVLDYATSPRARLQVDASHSVGFAVEMAVRPDTGLFCVTDNFSGIGTIVEIDPHTGQLIRLCSVFGVQSWAIDCDAAGSLVGQRWDNAPSRLFFERPNQGLCVDVPGPPTPSLNRRDLATEGGGTLLSLRLGSTLIDRIDRASGVVLGSFDTGESFYGIEVDTDGSIYGLTRDGILWDISLSPPSATAIGVLQIPGPADRWAGLAFRYAPPEIDVQPVCGGLINSAGQSASLAVGDPAAAGVSTLGFRVDGMPPGHMGVMLSGTSAGSHPLGAGVLCIGSGLARIPGVAVADAAGTARFAIDLSLFPGPGPVAPGDSYVFQCVYRDAPSVHFSSAVNVTFL